MVPQDPDPETLNWTPKSLRVGDHIGLLVTLTGELILLVNGFTKDPKYLYRVCRAPDARSII